VTLAMLAILCCSINLRADYVAERKGAFAQFQAGKYEEALAAFTNMAAGGVSDFQKADALEQAAECANRLKQTDMAVDLAKRIPLAGVSKQCRMRLMQGNWKYRDLIAEFKGEDIEGWPAAESVIGYGLLYRGNAYYRTKDGQAAETDLTKAANYFADGQTKAEILLTLGHNYRDNLQDKRRALEAYTRIIERMNGTYGYVVALVAAAGILRDEGKHDAAFKLLDAFDMNRCSGNGRGSLLAAYGETLAAQGRKTEAAAKFNEALAVKGISESQREAYTKQIKSLEVPAK
jgi:tetratricopeptide (TPR) repeat protein